MPWGKFRVFLVWYWIFPFFLQSRNIKYLWYAKDFEKEKIVLIDLLNFVTSLIIPYNRASWYFIFYFFILREKGSFFFSFDIERFDMSCGNLIRWFPSINSWDAGKSDSIYFSLEWFCQISKSDGVLWSLLRYQEKNGWKKKLKTMNNEKLVSIQYYQIQFDDIQYYYKKINFEIWNCNLKN
jgi:hypothetical protein